VFEVVALLLAVDPVLDEAVVVEPVVFFVTFVAVVFFVVFEVVALLLAVDPVLDEAVGLPKGRSSCAARAELLEGLTNVAPAGVLTLIEVFDLLLVVFPVVDETVGSPKQRSSCAARAELPAGFTHNGTELGLLAICGAADT